MQIEQEDYVMNNQEKTKKPKALMIIAILIALTIIIVIGIIFAIFSMQETTLSVIVDGNAVSVASDTFIFTDSGDIYVSIKDIASSVGYEAHNGEYKVDIEDTNKMYVESTAGTDTTSFYLNSTTISKVAPDTKNDYENITISQPVTLMNDKMYVISSGFSVAFNSLIYYNSEENEIIIQTLPYLVSAYAEIIEEFGYSQISEDFNNQKAIIYGMIVAYKESTGKYGVISTDGTEIISPRYNNIEFVESTEEFIITNSSSKVGIVYSTGLPKITVAYDEIKVMDSALGLYLVKSNNKYGVIDSLESTVIYIEYDQIGIDTSNFVADNIKNQYILYDTIIPAKINDKWRLFDIQGNRLTDVEYDEIGFVNEDQDNRIGNNALTIGETGTIIVGIDGVYGGVDVKGNELIPTIFEEIYSLTSAGVTTYYILYNETEYNATDYINIIKERLGYDDETETDISSNSNPSGQEENPSNNENAVSEEQTNIVQSESSED